MNKQLIILLLFCSLGVKAQYVGEWALGGRINYTNGGRIATPEGEIRKNGFALKVAPSLAYFVRNGMAVGMSVGYEYVKDFQGHQYTGEVVPFIHCDFSGGKFRPFLRLESGVGWGKSDMKKGSDGKHFLWTSALKPGLWIRITEQWATEATICNFQYVHARITDVKTDETLTRNKWKFRWLDISCGVNFIFTF